MTNSLNGEYRSIETKYVDFLGIVVIESKSVILAWCDWSWNEILRFENSQLMRQNGPKKNYLVNHVKFYEKINFLINFNHTSLSTSMFMRGLRHSFGVENISESCIGVLVKSDRELGWFFFSHWATEVTKLVPCSFWEVRRIIFQTLE